MEAETKTSVDEGNENAKEQSSGTVEGKMEEGKVDLGRVLEDEPHVESVVKPFVEELTQAAESLVQNVTDQPSSCVTQVEKEVEKLALVSGTNETSPTSDENPRTTHTQPFVAVTAATRASWTNCCGLLDVLRPSDQ